MTSTLTQEPRVIHQTVTDIFLGQQSVTRHRQWRTPDNADGQSNTYPNFVVCHKNMTQR